MKKKFSLYKEIRDKIWLEYSKRLRFITMLKTLIGNRKLLIWGASYKSDWFLELCQRNKILVIGYIDNNRELSRYGNLPVFLPTVLNKEKHFIFVALENEYQEVLCQLSEYGLEEFYDYIYPTKNEITIVENHREYLDLNGNEIQGIINGYHVTLSGGSKLIIGKNCKISRDVKIRLKHNSILAVENDCIINEKCIIELNNGACWIGNASHIGGFSTMFVKNAAVCIGEGFSCSTYFKLGAAQYSVCNIGKDCMFSTDIRVQCSDSHNYYDLVNKENIGMQKEYEVHIGEHVWIGAKCNIRYGADIGAGSMVGLGSLVNKKFPTNVILAGNPAKVVREHVSWIRDSEPFIEDEEFFEPYCYSEEPY